METSVNIKMYKVGELGDCHLLTFSCEGQTRHMLIDCGSFRNSNESKDRLKLIAEDLKEKVKDGKLDIVVGTHQHNDHVSGFVHAEKIFREIGVGQVWLSWLDNPRDRQAVRIGKSHLELRKALVEATSKMSSLAKTRSGRVGGTSAARKMMDSCHLINDVLAFFGAAPAIPSSGIKVLKDIGGKEVQYLTPGECRGIPGIRLSAIRVHVLGPPKNESLLYRKDPRKGESYDHKLQGFNTMATHFLSALGNQRGAEDVEERQFPFNMDYKYQFKDEKSFPKELEKLASEYNSNLNKWRNVDDDWVEQASRLALYMDTFTNNSSLVLAIELVKTGKVLLFAGDAQTGNWLSWQDIKFKHRDTSTESLLARTTLYKVGHHGSHNATLKDSLEKMTDDELVAMIPVDKTDPNITKKNGWKMPAPNLYRRLKELTGNRVLRMDDGYADECDPSRNSKAKSSWSKVSHKPKNTKLYVEYTVK